MTGRGLYAMAAVAALMLAPSAHAQTTPAAASSSVSSSATASVTAPPPAPAEDCTTRVIDHTVEATTPLYDENRRELGHIDNKQAPRSLKMAIADCDPYFFYLDPDAMAKVVTFTSFYGGGRAAVERTAVGTIELKDLAPPPAAPAKAKPKPRKK